MDGDDVMRNTWRYFTYAVWCEDCEWHTFGKNGLGNAALMDRLTAFNAIVNGVI